MRWFLALALALAGTACAGQPVSRPPALPAHVAAGQVYVTAGDSRVIWVVDSASGQVTRTLPNGTPAPDWRGLYRLSAGTLETFDPRNGRLVATHPSPDWAEVVRTSPDGRWLVLGRAGGGDRFQVRDAGWSSPPADVRLDGSFTFDGISSDGERLYLLEQLGAGHYQVRLYDLRRRALAPDVIADKSEVGQPMSGQALTSFTNGARTMQLTLYQRSARGQAFIHGLPVAHVTQFAFCVDLPGPAEGWGFVAAPDGRHMYAVNPSDRRVVELDAFAEGPPQTRQRQAGAGMGHAAQPALAVAPDSRTVYLGTDAGVLAIDTGTLKVAVRGLSGRPVTALALAPDGGAVYAVSGGSRLVRLDPRTLATAGEVALPGPAEAIVPAT